MVVAAAPGHELGEHLDNYWSNHRKASTDDSDIHLDDSPHGGRNVKGDIGRCCSDVDGGDSKAGGDDDEATQRKDNYQGDFLNLLDLQLVHGCHGHEQDDQIGRDGEAGVGIPELAVVDAGSRDAFVVCPTNWCALENGGNDRRDGIHGNDCHQTPTEPFEPADLAKDSKVQENNRALCQVDACLVRHLANEKELEHDKPSVSVSSLEGGSATNLKGFDLVLVREGLRVSSESIMACWTTSASTYSGLPVGRLTCDLKST